MKVKADFITNSSSSSFVVIGASLNKAELVLKRGPEADDIYDYVDRLVTGTDLVFSFGECGSYDNEDVLVGIEYTNMKDDETLGDFKGRVSQQIKDTFGVDTTPDHIELCWMDN